MNRHPVVWWLLAGAVLAACAPRPDPSPSPALPSPSLTLPPLSGGASRESVEDMMARIAFNVDSIAATLAPAYPEVLAWSDSTKQRLGYMWGRWRSGAGAGEAVPASYDSSLAFDIHLLRAARASDDPRTAYLLLQAVVDDVAIKAEHCRASGGRGLGGLIAVEARTFRGPQEVKGLQVVYIPKIMEIVRDAQPTAFGRLSGPTLEQLPPGRYVVWAVDPRTSRAGPRTTLKVGEGRKTLPWDIPIP